jgi:hypothetical protein
MNTLNENAPAAVAEKSGDFQSSHWYQYGPDGWSPLYEPGKSFTLREARKLHAEGHIVVPSVTTVFSVLAKPQLDRWKQENVAKACWDQHAIPTMWTQEAWIEQALATASGASKGAMDLGTKIHQGIEDFCKGKDYDQSVQVYVEAVAKERAARGITNSKSEVCVGSAERGYAGRVDDYSDDTMTVRDFKSRSSKGKKSVGVYSTDVIQGSAYGAAIWKNAFFSRGRVEIWGISTTTPGLVTVHEFSGQELIDAYETFLALTTVWRGINKFDARAKV